MRNVEKLKFQSMKCLKFSELKIRFQKYFSISSTILVLDRKIRKFVAFEKFGRMEAFFKNFIFILNKALKENYYCILKFF